MARREAEDEAARRLGERRRGAQHERVGQAREYTRAVLRTLLAALAVAVAAWLLVDALVTSDREEVERLVGRLVAAARRGGDAAVDEILAALADDYRGEGPFARDAMERRLRAHLGGDARLAELSTGDYRALWKGDEMFVPILSVRAAAQGSPQRFVLSLWFAERDGAWRITDITRVQWGQ